MKETDKNIYIDGIVKKALDDAINKFLKKDGDFIICIDGREGSGKSVLAQQIGYYMAYNLKTPFTVDNVVFKAKSFKETVINAKKFSVIVWDEALSGLFSRSAMLNTNKEIVDLLAEIRQKNLAIIIVLPSFFDLDKYVSVWRSSLLLHTYLNPETLDRGYYKIYTYQQKKKLYFTGKKLYEYDHTKPLANARFVAGYTVDEKKYREKKLKEFRAYSDEKEDKANEMLMSERKYLAALFRVNKYVSDNYGVTQKVLCEIGKISYKCYLDDKSKYKISL